jgi:hypothetical protein
MPNNEDPRGPNPGRTSGEPGRTLPLPAVPAPVITRQPPSPQRGDGPPPGQAPGTERGDR